VKKIGLFFAGLAGLAGSASAALVNDAAAVKTEIDALVGNAESVFDAVVPVILAVVGLGVLLAFIKMIKKR
tara:strand:- start:64 stop:276 length:213 start_codon:yes stop_codon:yes gene_type:complete